MKLNTIPEYQARPDGGHYTFLNGIRMDIQEVCIFGVEPSPYMRETNANDCAVQSVILHDGTEWREATDDELDEMSGNEDYMYDLVWSVIDDLTD